MRGRRRNPDPNLYSTKELALAVDISPRNVILLSERDDLPIVSGGGGPGQHRLLNITGFAKAVVIGAFADAGLPLSGGVKIANIMFSYRPLPQIHTALSAYLCQDDLATTAFDRQLGDLLQISIMVVILSSERIVVQSFPIRIMRINLAKCLAGIMSIPKSPDPSAFRTKGSSSSICSSMPA